MGKNLIDGVARATVNSAITGTDLETNIRTNVVASILGAAEAQGANWIGNQTLLGGDFNTNGNVNEFAHEFAHAIVGCAAGATGARAAGSGTSTGQGCGAGALGAVIGELSAKFYNSGLTTPKANTVAFAQMMSGIAAAAAGLGAEGVSIAANTGANAAQNNYLNHAQIEALGSAWAQCKTPECKQQLIKQYKALSNENDKALESCTSFNCVAGHLAAIRQADSALASAYQLDPTGQLGQTINGWQYHSQAVIAPFTANQQHLITSRKDTLVLYMNQFCRGVSANACATQMLQNEATSKAIEELAYMAAMFTPLGVVDDTKTLATGQNLTGEDSSRLLAVLGVLTAGESSALGKAVEKAGGLVKSRQGRRQRFPRGTKTRERVGGGE